MDSLYNAKQVAQALGCTEATIRKWHWQGRLPYVNVGRLVRYRQSDVEVWARMGLRPLKDGLWKQAQTSTSSADAAKGAKGG